MRDTPILTQRRKNCILVKTNLEKSFILGLLFVFQLTVSLLYRLCLFLLPKKGEYVTFPSLTLKRRINSHNACNYGHCGCLGVCIDMYYIWVFVLFAFFVFDTILRIELLVINSKSVLNLNVW